MYKTKTVLNKPIYCGVSILDLSKTLMYDFYYNRLKREYADRVNLLYTDTDSLLLSVRTDDVYDDMKKSSHEYDLSNYDSAHHLYDATNKKVIGKMKDEFGGRVVSECVCIRPKMYSILTADDRETKKAKGVTKVVTDKWMTHRHYRDCLFKRELKYFHQQQIRSDKHVLYTITQNKLSLSPLDTKRYIHPDGVRTTAFSHYPIKLD